MTRKSIWGWNNYFLGCVLRISGKSVRKCTTRVTDDPRLIVTQNVISVPSSYVDNLLNIWRMHPFIFMIPSHWVIEKKLNKWRLRSSLSYYALCVYIHTFTFLIFQFQINSVKVILLNFLTQESSWRENKRTYRSTPHSNLNVFPKLNTYTYM